MIEFEPVPGKAGLHVIVLGSAAGGGVPQWNSNSESCRRVRDGHPSGEVRTQTALAVSADGKQWVVLGATPDIRFQIEATPALRPDGGVRSSPIKAIILASADIDAIGGLLSLRERQEFSLYAMPQVHSILHDNAVFNVLHPDFVQRRVMHAEEAFEAVDGASQQLGVEIEAFAVPGKIPLYHEAQDGSPTPVDEGGGTVGLRVSLPGGRGSFFYIPNCAGMTPQIASRVTDADLVFFDGTFWSDDEMIRTGAGDRTGQRMAHMSVAGVDGVLAAFRSLNVKRKILIHVNNTNPLLLDDSPESAIARDAGWEVAHDGMTIRIEALEAVSPFSVAV